jgi:hypothetical protein
MKKALLFFLLLPFVGMSQVTRVSTQDGDFLNPLNWNPVGIPTSGDSIVIDHNMVLNTDIYYTDGVIHIRNAGQLIEDAMERSFWVDGTGSVINEGLFTTHLLLLSPNATFANSGNFIDIDSLWNQGTITNSVSGYATIFDFWNDQTGSFTNSGVLDNADSLLNQGVFITNTNATVYDFMNDQMGTFTNNGNMEVENNMNNQGLATNNASLVIMNDFSNCNIQTSDAIFSNSGRVCIANDFLNCIGDSLRGSGSYYIGGSSSNLGVFAGSFMFYTPSGTLGVPGTIMPGVTVTTGSCNLGLTEQEKVKVYPNPVIDQLSVELTNEAYTLVDISGMLIKTGIIENYSIDMGDISPGVYMLQLEGYAPIRLIKE